MDRSKLRLDEESHRYFYGDQPVRWSVTRVIRTILAPMPPDLDQDMLARAAAFGTAVHLATELDDQGRLDFATLDPRVEQYLEGWRLARREMGMEIVQNEAIVYSERLGYIGKLDRLVKINGQLCILDIKTGRRLGPEAAVQMAAYRLAGMETFNEGHISPRRLVVRLRPGGYTPKWYASPADENAFISALNSIRWREQYGDESLAALAETIHETEGDI